MAFLPPEEGLFASKQKTVFSLTTKGKVFNG